MRGPSGIPIKMLQALPRIFGARFQLIRHLSRQRRIFHGWFDRGCRSLPSCPLPTCASPQSTSAGTAPAAELPVKPRPSRPKPLVHTAVPPEDSAAGTRLPAQTGINGSSPAPCNFPAGELCGTGGCCLFIQLQILHRTLRLPGCPRPSSLKHSGSASCSGITFRPFFTYYLKSEALNPVMFLAATTRQLTLVFYSCRL